jgi:Mor family transcriptional regulator
MFESCCEDLSPRKHKQMRNKLMAKDREQGMTIENLSYKYNLEIHTISDILNK